MKITIALVLLLTIYSSVTLADTPAAVNYQGLPTAGCGDPSESLRVDGDICFTGLVGACSEARYKTDVHDLSSSLERVLQLRGVTYRWKQNQFPERNFDDMQPPGFYRSGGGRSLSGNGADRFRRL